MDVNNGVVIGVSNAPQAATPVTIQAFDSYGALCSMTFTITVLPVIPVSVLTNPKDFIVRSGYFFTHMLEPRMF